jgi:hypothetical protein
MSEEPVSRQLETTEVDTVLKAQAGCANVSYHPPFDYVISGSRLG